jgi:hypothetical protein
MHSRCSWSGDWLGRHTGSPLLRARELGYQIGVLQASQMGYNVYRRLGFQDFGKLSLYLWDNDRSIKDMQ